jgi:hypothetical protein
MSRLARAVKPTLEAIDNLPHKTVGFLFERIFTRGLLRELAGGFETVACPIAFEFLFYFKLTGRC